MPEEGTQVFWPEFGPEGDESGVASAEVGYYPTMLPQLMESGMLHDSHRSAASQASQIKLLCGDKSAVPVLLYPSDSYIDDVIEIIITDSDWACFGKVEDGKIRVRDCEDSSENWTLDADVVRRGLRMVVDARYNVDNVEMIMSITEDDAGYIDASLADEILQYGLFGEIVYS
jgi:hypothetical protein